MCVCANTAGEKRSSVSMINANAVIKHNRPQQTYRKKQNAEANHAENTIFCLITANERLLLVLVDVISACTSVGN